MSECGRCRISDSKDSLYIVLHDIPQKVKAGKNKFDFRCFIKLEDLEKVLSKEVFTAKIISVAE